MKCEHINFLIYYIIPLLHKKTPILTFWRQFYKSKLQNLIWIHTPSIQNYMINFDFLKVNLKMDPLNSSHSFMGSEILWGAVRKANLMTWSSSLEIPYGGILGDVFLKVLFQLLFLEFPSKRPLMWIRQVIPPSYEGSG